MKLQILSPGPLTTVQDLGRTGYVASGIGTSGVMDQDAYADANYLVGNRHGEAVLEATMLGPTIRFEKNCICAVTGADMQTTVDGVAVPYYLPFWVQAGQTLSMGFAKTGCRGYLAVQGGFTLPPALGSRSTNLKCALGGYEGRALRQGDVLTVPDDSDSGCMERKRRPPVFRKNVLVRVVPGPQADYFTQAGQQTFFNSIYTVSDKSDRMGLRLDGAAVETAGGSDIISDGIAFGSIQVPSSGMPIILMADRQTTGGYAKIGTVCTADLPKLAQVRPGCHLRFIPITVKAAQRLLKKKRLLHWIGGNYDTI